MSLIQGLIGARINETIYNYSRADQLLTSIPIADAILPRDTEVFTSDKSFWRAIITNRRGYVNKLFALRSLKISEWVPRVPGLAHKPESKKLLRLSTQYSQKVVELDGWRVYQPQEKSEHVMSGVGTLRLPPNANGEWLFSVSSTGDASSGVPILVLPDVWDRIQKFNSCEGRVISCVARWQPMAMEWSKHFRSTGDIPPGYFVLDSPDAIAVEDYVARTWVYPFTIMEYPSDVNELFDYVYCGAHTDDPAFRQGISSFFETYRIRFGGIHGRFLIAGDLVEGLWAAEFNSPADLLAQDASARSQLTLLMARINERMLGKNVIKDLLEKMRTVLSGDDLIRLSSEIEIDKRVWQKTNTTLAEQCSQFLAAVVAESKQDALLERLAIQEPNILR
jgi:hypothetical protein